MPSQSIRKNIGAYSVLFDYASKKRYGVINNDLPVTQIGSLARSLNKRIAKTSGIDIFQPVVSKEQIERYEKAVDTELKHYIKEHLSPPYESDEIEFLKRVVRLPASHFKNLFIKIEPQFRQEMKKAGLEFSEELLESVTRQPDYIECAHLVNPIGSEYPGVDWYLVTKYTDLSKSEIVLSMIRHHLHEKFGLLCFALTLKAERLVKNAQNPSKIFFQILDEIGLDINLESETKRFYFEKILPPGSNADYYRRKHKKITLSQKVQHSFLQVNYTEGLTATAVVVAYGIDISKYKSMVKKHQI